ncbi:TrmH family RNA methyltransferase [Numidum massiliense]|uniref:TrmH family RNA methyltransferase n=1 Tax=Numidum massiliense TaxID=1522315 RepID=UPI0006D56612|nr:RNA methyltransferase [Numidum massiliense]
MQVIEITSPQNDKLKQWRKLQQSRKERYRRRQLLVEGDKLLAEARASDCAFHAVLCDADADQSPVRDWQQWALRQHIPFYRVRGALFRQLMETDTPQGIAAVIDMPARPRFQPDRVPSLVLLLDRIQDPGNLGAILRTADAAGVSFVGLGKGTVDPFNPKVVRSAAGALFHLAFDTVDLPQWMAQFRQAGGTVFGTEVREGDVHYRVHYPLQTAILMGNEGQGVASGLLQLIDRKVRIPLPGRAESLNVATASAVLLYEVVRQWDKI